MLRSVSSVKEKIIHDARDSKADFVHYYCYRYRNYFSEV
jgi:hypothetical protein